MRTEGQSGEIAFTTTPSPHIFFFFLGGTNSYIASLTAVIVLCLVSFGRIQRSNMLCKNCYNFSRSFDVYLYIIWETFSCSKPCVWLLFWYWYLKNRMWSKCSMSSFIRRLWCGWLKHGKTFVHVG